MEVTKAWENQEQNTSNVFYLSNLQKGISNHH